MKARGTPEERDGAAMNATGASAAIATPSPEAMDTIEGSEQWVTET